ncbi:MAG TPA: alpha/beta fold hydrolase [Solirubrobacteraceae bacterium]|jgi:pimeloyl-ACP methyl ester carboxylesterase|nr:alpha/beta fold hydrolase [Solirubrobacteraceae bacterium]
MPAFIHDEQQIAFREFGSGPRTCVLIHGLLLSQRMHEPLARDLAARGNRVVTIDLLGHGRSDRPREAWRYSIPGCAEQVVALLDHLDVDEAVIAGTSLGANVTLETCLLAPERVRGMVVEMPVLDHALIACVAAFTPVLLGLTLGEPLLRLVARAARAVPRGALPFLGNVVLDSVRQEPAPSGAVMQGLFFGRVAPHAEQRRALRAPALVIGHRRDPVHPLSDAGMLADELPDARLLEASSILELRLAPERLTAEIAAFLEDCWRPARRAPRRRARAV